MFEMASSAATLLSPAGSVRSTSSAALLQVTIPAPLPLSAAAATPAGAAWAASAVVSVRVDTASGHLIVASQQASGLVQRTHLAASSVCVPMEAALLLSTPSHSTAVQSALVAGRTAADVGAATADVQRPSGDQSDQYSVHPAVIDCTTQVSRVHADFLHPMMVLSALQKARAIVACQLAIS